MATTRNPNWSRDELILALDLYKRFGGNPPKDGREIAELSATLNALGTGLLGRTALFRNPNGVYMKVMNFRRFDEAYSGLGKTGLTRGNKLEEEIWKFFANDQVRLTATATAILSQLNAGEDTQESVDEELETEAEEGRLLARVHMRRERSRKLVNDKKQKMLKENGRLICEVCEFDFGAVYGERGAGFIEVHHTIPLHTLTASRKTRLEDLALLCANCHRMVHAKSVWLTIDELKVIVSKQQNE